MQRLVQLGKKGLTAARFSKTNPDLSISGMYPKCFFYHFILNIKI